MKKILIILFLMTGPFGYSFSQNIGIGTNSPYRAKLEVHGAVDATSAIFGGESSGISLQRNWPAVGFNMYYGNGYHRLMADGYGGMFVMDPASGYMALDMMWEGTAGSYQPMFRAMVIAKEGRVNIGSAYPLANLNVGRGNFYPFYATASFEGSNHHSHFNYGTEENTYLRAGKDNGTVFINDITGSKIVMSGKVGINTSTPGFPLEIRQIGSQHGVAMVNGNSFQSWSLQVNIGGTFQLYRNAVHVGTFETDGDYHNVSDSRLKKNVETMPSLIGKVMQLRPVNYDMIYHTSTQEKKIGFIAQEVEQIFPALVSVNRDSTNNFNGITDMRALNYSGFGVVAIKAIQEQQEMIELQDTRIHVLELEIDDLKRLIRQLTGQVRPLEVVVTNKD